MRIALCSAAALLAVSLPAYAQHASHKMSDDEIVQMSLSAAPEAVAKDAKVIDIGADGKVRVIREGRGEWTCMPGAGDPAAPDPMCGDKNAMAWATAWMQKQEPPSNQVGILYMLRGDNGASNTDPYATEEAPDNNWIKTGAHIMIVGSGAKMLSGYSRDAKPDPSTPYVMWAGTPYEHVMLPVQTGQSFPTAATGAQPSSGTTTK